MSSAVEKNRERERGVRRKGTRETMMGSRGEERREGKGKGFGERRENVRRDRI